MLTQCPGQDGRNVKVGYYTCPNCGGEVEIFSFDVRVKCDNCGNMVYPDRLPSCIDWCASAERCLGTEKWRELQEAKKAAAQRLEQTDRRQNMTTKARRKIIKIDEEKCDGCGVCIPACAEGALQIVDGKAKLISEVYCDGLGACLGECPQGAITIEEREAEGFDEEATKEHLEARHAEETLPCGCPSTTVSQFEPCVSPHPITESRTASMLTHWPVQLTLVPPGAPFLDGADVVFVGDCIPFAYGNFHQDFVRDHVVLVACPKLDDFEAHQAKLTEILRQADLKSLTVVHMDVPCCSGLVHMAKQAITASGKDIPLKETTIGIRGDVLEQHG